MALQVYVARRQKKRKQLLLLGGGLWYLYLRRQHDVTRSIWTKDWLKRRDEFGAYDTLLAELKDEDQGSFLNFLRMSPGLFEELVTKVTPLIVRQDTAFRKCISPGMRVAITLRYLATGDSFKSLSYLFRVASNTIGLIVPETCRAIYDVLHDDYIQEFRVNLGERSVTYLNVDIAVQGNYSIRALGTPLLYTPLYEVAKKIETPNEPGKSIFDEWRESFPKPGNEDLPVIGSLGSDSDYASFLILTGITSLDVCYTYNKNKWPIMDYPLYHSVYETFHLVEKFIDRDFKFHRAMTQFWAEMARYLADSLILPLDVMSYAKTLEENVIDLDEGYGELMRNNNITLDGLHAVVQHFTAATEEFKARLDNVNKNNPAQTRMFNDQLYMKLERAFLDAAGLPDIPLYKHLVFAPSSEDADAGATFPGLVDLMFEMEADPNPAQRWERVKHHLSVIIFTIQSAASTLTDASSV